MRTLNQLAAMLQDVNITTVARKTGLNWITVNRIKEGSAINPNHRTVELLNEYFNNKEVPEK